MASRLNITVILFVIVVTQYIWNICSNNEFHNVVGSWEAFLIETHLSRIFLSHPPDTTCQRRLPAPRCEMDINIFYFLDTTTTETKHVYCFLLYRKMSSNEQPDEPLLLPMQNALRDIDRTSALLHT